jgi:cytochrome c oxidase subunit 2
MTGLVAQPIRRVIATGLVLVAACGGADSDSDRALSPAATVGRTTMLRSGCASCHGSNGQGGVGPAFVGLFGSNVTVTDEDGEQSTVTADDAYLDESIRLPARLKVDGFSLPMPTNRLTDAEIASVIDYIRELQAPVAP